MITSESEWLEKLSAIQNGTVVLTTLPEDEPRFVIDANARTIEVPDEFKNFIAVKGDHKAETVIFEIDRYFDNTDLFAKSCVVQFYKPSKEGIYEGFCPVVDMDITTVPGKLLFGWQITNDVTETATEIMFSVRFYSIDSEEFSYNFNTLPVRTFVADSLDARDIPLSSLAPSVLQKWYAAINNLALVVSDDNNGNVAISFVGNN